MPHLASGDGRAGRRRGPTSSRTGLAGALFLALLAATGYGCVVYEPVPVTAPPPASKYDRVWDSALRAAGDSGIAVTVADKPTGTIRGSRGAIAVAINVLRQADGSVRVELDLKGQLDTDPSLSSRFNQAYERYMGR
jgi:hypothetical protein